MKKKALKKWLPLVLAGCLLTGSVLSVSAAGRTRDMLKSIGRIDSAGSVFEADDLYHIADRIDVLKEACR